MEEQLFEAAKTGNAEILHHIQDPKIAARQNPQGDTACHVALQEGHLEFALQIASLHPPILYTSNMEGDTVLHRALKVGQPEFFVQSVNIIRKFLGKNIKYTNELPWRVNSLMLEARRCYNSSRDREQRSLVFLAATNGYFEAVKILMKTPALSSTDGPRKSTALHAAVLKRHYGIVQLLMKRKGSLIFEPDEDKHTPMFIAVVVLKCIRMCNLLLMEDRKNTTKMIIGSENGLSAFHLAAQNDDCLEIFQLFTERCPRCYFETSTDGQNVLHIAIKAEALAIVKFIVKDNKFIFKGKKLSWWLIKLPDNDGNTPLSLATASNGNEEMLNALLARPVNVPPLKDGAENKGGVMGMEFFHSSLLVTATIITTVTFAAAFSLPGGYKGEGTAALIASAAFRVFLVFDTLSLLTSIGSMSILIAFVWASRNYGPVRDELYLGVAGYMVWWSLMFMLVAFAAGAWAVIASECKWLAILIATLTSIVICSFNPFSAAVIFRLLGYR